MTKPTTDAPNGVGPATSPAGLRRRLSLPIALLAGIALFAGCSGSNTNQAANSPSATSASTSTTSTSTSTSATAATNSTGSPNIVACNVFNLGALNTATGLTWTVIDRSQPMSCTISAENGNTIAMNLIPTSGQTDEVVKGIQNACDAGTIQPQNVADGGYTCQVGGVASGGAIYAKDNLLVAVSAVTFNGASTDVVQSALIDLLKSFVA